MIKDSSGVTNRTHRSHYPSFRQIPHYYGDVVRMLLLGAAMLMLAGAPFYTVVLADVLPFLVIGAIVAVALAALTSPRSRLIMRLDAVASGVGALVFEYWALASYHGNFPIEFVLRQIVALIFMFAFYYSLKTLRAMISGAIDTNGSPSIYSSGTDEELMAEDGFTSTPDDEETL